MTPTFSYFQEGEGFGNVHLGSPTLLHLAGPLMSPRALAGQATFMQQMQYLPSSSFSQYPCLLACQAAAEAHSFSCLNVPVWYRQMPPCRHWTGIALETALWQNMALQQPQQQSPTHITMKPLH